MPNDTHGGSALLSREARQTIRRQVQAALERATDRTLSQAEREQARDEVQALRRQIRQDDGARFLAGFRALRLRLLRTILEKLIEDDGSGPEWLSDAERFELEDFAAETLDGWLAFENVPVIGPLLEAGSDTFLVAQLASWVADEAQRIVNEGREPPRAVRPIRAPASLLRPKLRRKPTE